jgi:hypothetical protein
MARTSGKKAAKKVGRPRKALVDSGEKEQPVDLQKLRQQIAQLVAEQMQPMTKAISDEASKGHLAQFRYLLELIGLYPATPGDKPEIRDSDDLAAELLKSFDFPKQAPEEENEMEMVTSAEGSGDSVE